MTLPSLPYIVLTVLWFALIVYAVFGGADFGAGVWEMFALNNKVKEQNELINGALGPVWETNHVWLVFLVVGLFSGFPGAFSTIVAVLFLPLTLALIGTVLRGSSFIFRTHGLRRTNSIWTSIFSLSSAMTPFFLGASAAAVASGQIQDIGPDAQTNLGSIWLSPFAVTIGVLAIALCATTAAIFLTVEATDQKKHEIAELFRRRGLISGAITAVLGAAGILEAPSAAPVLWQGMLSHAIPLVIATMVIGAGAALTLFFAYYRISRILIIAETAFMLGTWGVSQIPYIIPPKVTVNAAASQPSTQLLLLIGIIVGMALILPSIAFLFYIFKYQNVMNVTSRGAIPANDPAARIEKGITRKPRQSIVK